MIEVHLIEERRLAASQVPFTRIVTDHGRSTTGIHFVRQLPELAEGPKSKTAYSAISRSSEM